ncbi:MAG TPA: hypothetical protein PKX48_05090 [Planctomycetota bacterium]|nr:hypothetical protein [Planctomycetota bacterium]OQC21805.1 MAG: hypothetical protein BWX69_00450 [Planctomycetes bacterium ADurb.Bin069]HNR98244.1 hypothetical protein [Planctomycetota bacterium]HNU24887.1 hypothetical protein [Planctomycetota bacterium]HOE29489.1 hypothetical protein [Planctomycetota bacterium]
MRRLWTGLLLCMGGIAFAALTPTDVPSDGSVLPAGSAVESPAGTWTLRGGGADIWGAADQFFYLYDKTPVDGDFAISCHVKSLTGGDAYWAKVGLMARVPEGTTPEFVSANQPYNFVCVTTTNGACHQYRDTTGADATDVVDTGEGIRVAGLRDDVWIKLVREGDSFSAYVGPAKGIWVTAIGSHENLSLLGEPMYVGLAITSHQSGAYATAVVDNVNFNDRPVSLNGPTNFVCAPDGMNVDLMWTNRSTYSSITLYRKSEIDGTVTPIPLAASAQAHTDSPGTGLWSYYIRAVEGGAECLAPAGCTAAVTVGNAGFIDGEGFFRSWLLFGPINDTFPCATPLNGLTADFITDGAITERNMLPAPGDEHSPDWSRTPAGTTRILGPFTNSRFLDDPEVNPGAPNTGQWRAWHNDSDTLDLNGIYSPAVDATDLCVSYAVCYLVNTQPTLRVLIGGAASDDSIAVMLDNVYVHANGACRSWGNPGQIQDLFPVLLPPGEHRLIVKTFDEFYGFGFRFRLHNLDGTPLTEADGIQVKLAPSMTSVPAAPVPQSNFGCAASGKNVNLSWVNGQSYGQVLLARVDRDGAVTLIPVGPTATSLVDTVPAGGDYTYLLGAVTADGRPSQVQSCSLNVGNVGVIDDAGYFRTWLLFGPISETSPCARPRSALIADFYTNGVQTEANMLPRPGDVHSPDWSRTPAGTNKILGPFSTAQANPGAPNQGTWYLYESGDGLINLNDSVYSDDPDYCMSYAVIYLYNNLPTPRLLVGACNSDDSIAVALDNTYFWAPETGGCRGDTGTVVDRFPFLLPPGEHRLMVKTFDYTGGFNFRFRLENADGSVLTDDDDIEIRYVPTITAVPPAPTATATRTLPSVMIIDYEATVSITVAGQALDLIDLVPSTMTIGAIGNGGTRNGQQISWTNIPAGTTVTYKVTPTTVGGRFYGTAREVATNAWLAIGGQAIPVVPVELADGWLTANIADSGLAGTATVTKTGSTYTMAVQGSGHDIWDTADDFRFVWKSFPADKSLVLQCQLAAMVGGTNVWSKYGLMFRTFPTQGSPCVYAVYSRDGGSDTLPDPAFQWRDVPDGGALHDEAFFNANHNHPLPAWIRMVYNNGLVTAYFADDDGGMPDEWYPPWGVTHPLNLEGQDSFLAGVCVTSHDDTQLTTGQFKHVEIVPLCEPVTVTRSFGSAEMTYLDGVPAALYEDGADLPVALELTNPRVAGGNCPALGAVTIVEMLPLGFMARNISHGGTYTDGSVVWTFAAGNLPAGPLTYVLSGAAGVNAAYFEGEVSENPAPNPFGPFQIFGPNAIVSANALGTDPGIEGVVLSWLLLGPFAANTYDGTANHIYQEMIKDFLTDGMVSEDTVTPRAGDEIRPDYGMASAATGLNAAVNHAVNPKGKEGIATWFPFRYSGPYYDFTYAGLYGANDYSMNYSVAYLDVREPVEVTFAMGSDDAIQVLLDGTEIWHYDIGRAWPGFTDRSEPHDLEEGVHTLMVKCFNGVGGWNQSVQILDAEGRFFTDTDTICVSLNPDGCGTVQIDTIYVWMGNVNGDAAVNIADAVAILQYLFAGGKPPVCAKAADANDDDAINIADAVKILGFLFSGQAMAAPDGSTITAANNACKGYAANGVDHLGKPYFPTRVSGLPACAVPCKR